MSSSLVDRPGRLTATITGGAILLSWIVSYIVWHMYPDVNALLHFTISTLMPGVMAPLTIYPLARTMMRLRELRRQLEMQARTDFLTELPNRRYFFERAAEAECHLKSGDGPHTVMLIDIDRFKDINDDFGHSAGDAVIRAISCAIKDAVQASGAENWTVGRVGGEEFAVMVEKMDERAAVVLAAHICDQVRETWTEYHGETLRRTVSLGIAMWDDGEDIDSAMLRADKALYCAKDDGRDKWVLSGTENETLTDAVRARARSFPVASDKRNKYPKGPCKPVSTPAHSTP